jgi:hypothetical protein
VVFAARGRFASIKKTFDCLQSQTAVDRIDLLLTSDSPALLREAERHIQARGVLVNPRFLLNHTPELASARLIAARAATADILTIAGDHSFPDPNFAEELLAVFDSVPEILAASPLVHNPNSETAVSRAYFILAHGCLNPIPGSSRTSEAARLPWHNTTYRRTAFLSAARDVGLMQAEGLLQAEIRRTTPNARFVHCQQTALWHVNISRLGPALWETFHGGRVFGAERARYERWGQGVRLVRAGLFPLVAVRKVIQCSHQFFSNSFPVQSMATLACASLLAFAHAFGESVGNILGKGDSAVQGANWEYNRARFLKPEERHLVVSEGAFAGLPSLQAKRFETSQPQAMIPDG